MELGVVAQDAELTRRHDEIPGWDDMPAEKKLALTTLALPSGNPRRGS